MCPAASERKASSAPTGSAAITSACGAIARVAKAVPDDVRVSWIDLDSSTHPVTTYQVVVLDADDLFPPWPAEMDAAPVIGEVPVGVEELPHPGGLGAPCFSGAGTTPCRLLYYKARATSPCTATPGPCCDGSPAQVPCP